ncbi:hypothetical protein N7493_011460 [Penicillium malachiteum]|uniref:Uncharacterized protein n=1 Tax=Penicillium malachiteum TaxID=1324776 RepID=A0AAD6MQG1_9EURO|nr:hypothetical protein N7493_011460 [Penicillium malachiteum]
MTSNKVHSVPNIVRPVRTYLGGLRHPSPKVDLEAQVPERKVYKYDQSDIPKGWKLLYRRIPWWLPEEKCDKLKKERKGLWHTIMWWTFFIAVGLIFTIGMWILTHQAPQPRPSPVSECKAVETPETQEHHNIEDFRGPEQLEEEIKSWVYVPVKDQVVEDAQHV